MEKQLNFAPKLSLEELALRRVVVNLWNEKDILSRIQNFPFEAFNYFNISHDFGQWKKTIEFEVHCQWSKLVLPEALKKRMVILINPIGHQILRWKSCHEEFDASVLEHLCWKSVGTVDYLKTAGKLVRLETIDVVKLYRLACWYCLEDCIPRLWEELPEEYKSRFPLEFNKIEFTPNEIENNLNLKLSQDLENYWACVLKEELNSVDKIHHFLFRSSACAGNKAATEYFFQKLAYEKRDSYLFSTVCFVIPENVFNSRLSVIFGRKKLSDVFCYLLSLMSHEHLMQVLKMYPDRVLTFFLFWPWQYLFLDIADLIWTFLPESEYKFLSYKINDSIKCVGYYFPDLIQKIFLKSPSDFRKHFASACDLICPSLFNYDDTETLKVILGNVAPLYTDGFIPEYWFAALIRDLILMNKLHVADLCIREMSLSEEDKWMLKRKIYAIYIRSDIKKFSRRLEHFFKTLDVTEVSAPDEVGNE